MSKRVRIQVSGSLGADLTTISIYKNEISASNLLTASITASALTDGIFFDVEDDIYDFVARADDGACINTSGSVTVENAANTRYFNVISDGDGSVQVNAPTPVDATSGSISQKVNFNVHSLFTIEATTTGYGYAYGNNFQGWYHVASGSTPTPTLLSSASVISITNDTFTDSDNFYAYFA